MILVYDSHLVSFYRYAILYHFTFALTTYALLWETSYLYSSANSYSCDNNIHHVNFLLLRYFIVSKILKN